MLGAFAFSLRSSMLVGGRNFSGCFLTRIYYGSSAVATPPCGLGVLQGGVAHASFSSSPITATKKVTTSTLADSSFLDPAAFSKAVLSSLM